MSYTNSKLVSYTKISPNRNINRNHKIDTVSIHCVSDSVLLKLSVQSLRQGARRQAQTMVSDMTAESECMLKKKTVLGVHLPVRMITERLPLKLLPIQKNLMQ